MLIWFDFNYLVKSNLKIVLINYIMGTGSRIKNKVGDKIEFMAERIDTMNFCSLG